MGGWGYKGSLLRWTLRELALGVKRKTKPDLILIHAGFDEGTKLIKNKYLKKDRLAMDQSAKYRIAHHFRSRCLTPTPK